jgi:hypothetical protein
MVMAAQVVPDLIRPDSLMYSGLHLQVLFLQRERPLAFSKEILMQTIYRGAVKENRTLISAFSAQRSSANEL